MRRPYPTDLSDAEWNYIEPHLPAPKDHGRPRIHSLREILDAIFHVLRSGCQWRLLPHDFPRWPTVYYYFRKMAYRRHLGEYQSSFPRTSAGSLEARSSAQRGYSGQPVGQNDRSGRRRAWLRWRKED